MGFEMSYLISDDKYDIIRYNILYSLRQTRKSQ